MKHTEPTFQNWGEAVRAAQEALDAKHYDDAKHHLHTALQMGADSTHVRKLQTLVRIEEDHQDKVEQHSGFFGFFVAVVCYFILSFFLQPQHGILLWGVVALGLFPALIGWRVGKWMGYDSPEKARFWKAVRAVGGAVWCYAFMNMIYARMQFSMSSAGGDVTFVWLLVPLVYASIAGCVAGVVCAKLSWRQEGN